MSKLKGGIGLKDLKTQGTVLGCKWIFKALKGDEPWKVLIRHYIQKFVPKRAPTWKGLPFCDLVAGNFAMKPMGSPIFNSLWKAWEWAKSFISNNGIFNMDSIIWG